MRVRDNFDAFDVEDARLSAGANKRPKCDLCDEPIYEDFAYRIGDLLVCDQCVDNSKFYGIDDDYYLED